MFKFRHVTGRFPGMRKDQEFTICPGSEETPHLITIQSDKRIARVNTETSKTIISDGKGGHQGFAKLNAFLGAKTIDTPKWLSDQLANLETDHGPNDTGEVCVMDSNGPAPTVHARTDGPVSIFDL